MSHTEIANQILQDLHSLNVSACVGGSTALIIHDIQRPEPNDIDILIYLSSGQGNAAKALLLSNFGARYASDNAGNLLFRQNNATTVQTSVQLLVTGPYASLGWLRLDIQRSSVVIQGIQTLNLSFCLLSKLVAANTRLQDRRPGAERQQKGQQDKADVLLISTKMREPGTRSEGTLSRAANSCWRYFDREELLLLERIGVRFDRR
ncbi:hypothetical protein VE03_07859 [Pseudogymnoascus sp. 23342-1-I1]|nr:hypothetical protein VE03_07859 [Pseudogymnoascus sp. 23342-1-I1]